MTLLTIEVQESEVDPLSPASPTCPYCHQGVEGGVWSAVYNEVVHEKCSHQYEGGGDDD